MTKRPVKTHTNPKARTGHDAMADVAETIDTAAHAALSSLTGGLSPAALGQVYADWALHLAASPGKQAELGVSAVEKFAEFQSYLMRCAMSQGDKPCLQSGKRDRRFRHPDWDAKPFGAYKQGFLLAQQWWEEATTGIHGVSAANEKAVGFAARQVLDAMSPANFPMTNPEIIEKTVEENGANIMRGYQNYIDDMKHTVLHERFGADSGYKVGENLAVTPGKVVFRNHLIELIQYEPTTDKVCPEPVLIVPAWIMKYYILDLSPENSMVKYLTEQGYTVFMISWRNPGAEDAKLGFDDYRRMGPLAAIDEVQKITGSSRIHAAGYCLGGTLLSVTAAAMARDGDERLASMTLFAAQIDFTEAGELMLFINESQVSFLEDMMWKTGYLDATQMSGAFQLLRSSDLVWSRIQHEYLMGEKPRFNDLMSWNADTTRMPYRMHSEYLRKLFLNNDFAEGKFMVGDNTVTPYDIRLPIFSVGTETDHVAPWKSAYKVEQLTHSPVTFVLTNGGHNAGVVSEPGHPRRHYMVHSSKDEDQYLSPDHWQDIAEHKDGSWWPEWVAWLDAQQQGEEIVPPKMGKALCDAPGTYVMME
ncbi:Poly-beta-hydroxybutyrate polymerase [Shimia thalassica]|uniref:Poly-beta-hydroxybutyrate polymerase n=1 Tax=Shimia thalassica TaxID=1715693 RepID=A0A0P1ILH8_9RHOB|nr:alpha/beta fold hydrolase [Shimia thalassica]CUJ83909.1 Poly-beta-hydroxybutyrate polymerase [Shimia thalassica]